MLLKNDYNFHYYFLIILMNRIDTSNRDSVVVICFIVVIVIQFVATILKRHYRRSYESVFDTVADANNSDQYLEYYKKIQSVDIYRMTMTVVLVVLIIWRTDSNVMQAFAIATGAIILVFQSLIMSVVIYLMLLPRYKVGETIKVGTL
jgi:flagellar biosynthesis protein FlhB